MAGINLNKVNKTITSLKISEIFFIVIAILYLFSGTSINYMVTQYVNNIMMYVTLIIIAILLHNFSNPVVVFIFTLVIIKIVIDSNKINPVNNISNEENKVKELKSLNSPIKLTLEEECVSKNLNPTFVLNEATYNPVNTKLYNATNF